MKVIEEFDESKFFENGFAILRSFFDKNEIAYIYDAIRQNEYQNITKIKNLLKIGQFDESDVAIEENSLKYLKYADFWFNHISKIKSLRLMMKIGELISDNVYLDRLELHQKFPGVSGTPPHQDNFYFALDLEKNFACTAYIPLNEQTEEQGVLEVYPGSHLKVFDHKKSSAVGFSSEISKADLKEFKPYTTNLFPGDLLLFHCNTAHQAKANKSSIVRSNIAIRFYPSNPQYDYELKSKYQDFLSKSSRIS